MYIKIPCDQVSFELKKMGVHPTGIALMAPKAVVEPLRLVGVQAPGANIIKQEMLAMGADAANAKGTINCSIERTDVILLGSRTQYRHLAHKLRANQGWFGLDEVISRTILQTMSSRRSLRTDGPLRMKRCGSWESLM